MLTDVQGMKALHDCKRCFFDLKPLNILVSNWMDPKRVCCTIIDLAGSLEEGACKRLATLAAVHEHVSAYLPCHVA